MFLTKKFKFIFLSLFIVLSFLIVVQVGVAASDTKALEGLNTTAEGGFGVTVENLWQGGPSSIIGKIIGAGLAFLGVIFFSLMVYSGISWMFAMGNEEKITEAKNMIIAAVLGLIVVLAAYAITSMVAGIFSGTAIP